MTHTILLDSTIAISMGSVVTLVIALLGFNGTVFGVLFSHMNKRFDTIEMKLDPLNTKVEKLETEVRIEIKALKESEKEQNDWLSHYDGRLQKVERVVAAAKLV